MYLLPYCIFNNYIYLHYYNKAKPYMSSPVKEVKYCDAIPPVKFQYAKNMADQVIVDGTEVFEKTFSTF